MVEGLNPDDLKPMHIIYFVDIDPDTGFVSQMKPVAYVEREPKAEAITKFLNLEDGEGNVWFTTEDRLLVYR